MAAKIPCRACGRMMFFGDGQGLRLFCSLRCDETVVTWLNAAYAKGTPGAILPRPPVVGEVDEEENRQVMQLVALAVDESTTHGERANAAIAACRRIVAQGLLVASRGTV